MSGRWLVLASALFEKSAAHGAVAVGIGATGSAVVRRLASLGSRNGDYTRAGEPAARYWTSRVRTLDVL